MIRDVEFNTLEKAMACYKALGQRAVDIFHVEFKEKRIGKFHVHYFTTK